MTYTVRAWNLRRRVLFYFCKKCGKCSSFDDKAKYCMYGVFVLLFLPENKDECVCGWVNVTHNTYREVVFFYKM